MMSSELKLSSRNFECPKKPKRAFDFFYDKKKKEYQNKNLSSQIFTSIVCKEWRHLSENDKQ